MASGEFAQAQGPVSEVAVDTGAVAVADCQESGHRQRSVRHESSAPVYEPFNGNNSLGYKSNGRYVPWLVRRALKQLGGESRCRLEVVTSCSGIIEVVLSRRNLDSVPPEVFDFLSLETLRLDNNNLQMLDAHVGRLQNLKYLLLGKNQLSALPASLANCRQISELDVQCNRLSSIPASVWRLKRLACLNLAWNQLAYIPPDIARLKQLRLLDLEGNILCDSGAADGSSPPSLPTEMVLLEHLRVLNIGENALLAVPTIVCRLPTLRALNLAGNKLTDLPPSFVRLEYLSELSLAGNQLATVPACLSELKSLRYLNMSRNLLRVLPASLAQLDRLQILLAAGNNLIAISDCLSQNLQVLDVSQNKLRNLCVGKLKHLTDLNVSHNRLEVLPMGIGVSKGSKRLVRLSASCNRIARLNAEELMALSRLQHLDLSCNNIATLSAELLRFMAKRIKEYCLQGNPIASANQSSAFPMCRHVSKADDAETAGQCGAEQQQQQSLNHQSNKRSQKSAKSSEKGEMKSNKGEGDSTTGRSTLAQPVVSARPSSNSRQSQPASAGLLVEAEVSVTKQPSNSNNCPNQETNTDAYVPVGSEQTQASAFPPPPPSIIEAQQAKQRQQAINNDADYATHVDDLVPAVSTIPPPVPPPLTANEVAEYKKQKFSEMRSPDVARMRRRRAGACSPTEARLNDSTTRVLRVGSAGGAFRIDFSATATHPVRAASPSPASPQPSAPATSPHHVKVFVPPQALAHTSNIVVKFLYVDEVGLAEIADEKIASHVVAFSPVVFMKASPFLSAASPAAVAARQASTPLTTRLYEDLTLTLNLSSQAEAAVGRRACTVHVVDVLVVAGSVLEAPEAPARIVCAPHPRARMSSTGQQVVVKFGHLGNGVAVIVSRSSNRRKACRAAEYLIRAELHRRAAKAGATNQIGGDIESTGF